MNEQTHYGYHFNDCGVCMNTDSAFEFCGKKSMCKIGVARNSKGEWVGNISCYAGSSGMLSPCLIDGESFATKDDVVRYYCQLFIDFVQRRIDRNDCDHNIDGTPITSQLSAFKKDLQYFKESLKPQPQQLNLFDL